MQVAMVDIDADALAESAGTDPRPSVPRVAAMTRTL